MTTSPTSKEGTASVAPADDAVSPRLRSGSGLIDDHYGLSPRARNAASEMVPEVVTVTPRARVASGAAPDVLVKLWPAHPNWATPVVERLAWSTEVLTSHDLTEQRAGWMRTPGRAFIYDYLLSEWELPHVEAILYALQDTEMWIPVWTDAQRLYTPVPQGEREIGCETSGMDLTGGGSVAIFAGDYGEEDFGAHDAYYEVREVASVDGSGIELVAGFHRSWPRGSKLVPVRLGILGDNASFVRPTAKGGTGSITADLTDPGWSSVPSLVADTYRGIDVMPFKPNRAQDITENYVRVRTVRGSIGGILVIDGSRRDRPAVERSLSFLFSGRSEIGQLRSWLHRCAGQRKRFWCASFQADLELSREASASHNWLQVKSVRGAQLYGQAHGPRTEDGDYRNPGRRDIEIRERAGAAPIRRRIVSWSRLGDGDEQLVLDDPIGADLTPGRAILSWLSEQRLAADQIELRWITDQLVETTLPMRSL